MQNKIKSYASVVKMYEAALHNENKKEKRQRDKISKQGKKISKFKERSMYSFCLYIY
jgi:hypothetical protein